MAVSTGIRVAVLPDLGQITDTTTFVGYKGGVGDVTALGLAGYVRGDVTFYGAKGDGATDDTAAILAMQAAVGRIVFPAGTFRIPATTTITAPMTFAPGAKLTIDNGATLYMEGRQIDAPRQIIFTGAGVVRMRKAGITLGSPAFPEWWGNMTAGQAGVGGAVDCAPVLQKMADAHSTLTEWHATMIGGLYQLQSGVTFGRGTFLQGLSSNRRVVFRLDFPEGDVFTTAGEACRFEGLQFETNSTIQRTGGITINAAHGGTRIVECNPEGYIGIRLGGPFSVARNCSVGFSATQTQTGGCGILIDSSLCEASNIQGSAHDADAALIRVRGATAAHALVSGVRIIGTQGVAVDVVASGADFLTNVRILNVSSRDGNTIVVRVLNTGTGAIWNTVIDGVSAGPNSAATAVRVENTAGGNIARTLISNVVTRDILNGIVLAKTAGALDRTGVSMCQLNLCTNPFVQTGSPTNVVIANTVFV